MTATRARNGLRVAAVMTTNRIAAVMRVPVRMGPPPGYAWRAAPPMGIPRRGQRSPPRSRAGRVRAEQGALRRPTARENPRPPPRPDAPADACVGGAFELCRSSFRLAWLSMQGTEGTPQGWARKSPGLSQELTRRGAVLVAHD